MNRSNIATYEMQEIREQSFPKDRIRVNRQKVRRSILMSGK